MVSADPGVPGGENKCGWAGYHKSPYPRLPSEVWGRALCSQETGAQGQDTEASHTQGDQRGPGWRRPLPSTLLGASDHLVATISSTVFCKWTPLYLGVLLF